MTLSPHDDDGGAGLLGLGLGVCAAMLLTGGVTVTSTQLARIDVMDAAAFSSASAADRISEAAIYANGVAAVTLQEGEAAAEARRALAATHRPGNVTSWSVAKVSVHGAKVDVEVQAVVKPPVIGSALAALGAPIIVTVTSSADAHVAGQDAVGP